MKLFMFLCVLFMSTPASAESSYNDASLKRAAKKVSVPYPLLRAICWAESTHKRSSFNYKDGGRDNHAIGMCQVLINTGHQYIKSDSKCKRDFRTAKEIKRDGDLVPKGFKPIPRIYKECNLFGPYTNALVAAKYLKSKLIKYNWSWSTAVVAYNSGTPRLCPSKGYYTTRKGRRVSCEMGSYKNQKYLDRVLRALESNR